MRPRLRYRAFAQSEERANPDRGLFYLRGVSHAGSSAAVRFLGFLFQRRKAKQGGAVRHRGACLRRSFLKKRDRWQLRLVLDMLLRCGKWKMLAAPRRAENTLEERPRSVAAQRLVLSPPIYDANQNHSRCTSACVFVCSRSRAYPTQRAVLQPGPENSQHPPAPTASGHSPSNPKPRNPGSTTPPPLTPHALCAAFDPPPPDTATTATFD